MVGVGEKRNIDKKWRWPAQLFQRGQREERCDADFTNAPFQ